MWCRAVTFGICLALTPVHAARSGAPEESARVAQAASGSPAAGKWVQSGTSSGCTANTTAPTGSCSVGATTTSFAGPGNMPGVCPPKQTFGRLYHWICE
jgi:hypothetical protein